MPAYNSEKFIKKSIESVLNQTYSEFELIICDDNSKDRTLNIIQKYLESDHRVKLVNNVFKKGAPGARNSCLKYAKGKYIAFLDSDDIWLKNKLNDQISFMKSNNYFFTYSYYSVIDENDTFQYAYKAPNTATKNNMLMSNFIPCLTVIYDSEIIGKVNQPDILRRNDYALWLKILYLHKHIDAYCFRENTALYRKNSYGLSSGARYELLKFYRSSIVEYASISNLKSYLYSFIYLLVTFLKKKLPSFYNKIVVYL